MAVLALWALPIRYAEEARSYSVLLLFSSACMFLYYDSNRTKGGVAGKGFYACLVLLAFSHLFGLLLAESFLLVSWWRTPRLNARLGLVLFAAVLLAAVLGPLLASGASQYAGGNFWIRFTPATVLKTFASLITPAGALLLGYAAFVWKTSGNAEPLSEARKAVLWSLAPFALMLAGSLLISFHTPILVDRNLIGLCPAMALVVSLSLAKTVTTPRGWLVCGALGLLAVQAIALAVAGRLFIAEQFRSIADRSVTLDRKVCYVVPDRAPNWEYVMNFYIEARLHRPDLKPVLIARSALPSARWTSDCTLWADAHPDDATFTLAHLPAFARCAVIPLVAPHQRSASTLLECPNSRQ
jgi:hypothetical protein